MKIIFIYYLTKVWSKQHCVCKEEPESIGFSANDFQCIDDTFFRHFTSSTDFVVKQCAEQGACFTRVPPNKNPCIGKKLAQQLDG